MCPLHPSVKSSVLPYTWIRYHRLARKEKTGTRCSCVILQSSLTQAEWEMQSRGLTNVGSCSALTVSLLPSEGCKSHKEVQPLRWGNTEGNHPSREGASLKEGGGNKTVAYRNYNGRKPVVMCIKPLKYRRKTQELKMTENFSLPRALWTPQKNEAD